MSSTLIYPLLSCILTYRSYKGTEPDFLRGRDRTEYHYYR